MEFHAVRRGQRIIVRLAGELDHHSAEQVRQALDTILGSVLCWGATVRWRPAEES